MPHDCLKQEMKDSIAILTMNNPEKRNPLDADMRAAFAEAVSWIKYNKDIRAVIITGEGKAFCAGGDLRAMNEGISPVGGRRKIERIHDFVSELERLEKPVIAAVNGAAIGAGMGLVLACDMIIASSEARFGATFNKVGLIPDYGTLYLLPRLVGMAHAKDILMTARLVTAAEFYEMGALKAVVQLDELMPKAMELAGQLAKAAPFAVGLCKRLVKMSFECSFEQMLQFESLGQAICYQTEDHKEGVKAFLEKRPAVFIGE